MIKNYILILTGIISSTMFLNAQNNRIEFNNQELFLSGMNLAWLDYANDLDNLDVETFASALDDLRTAKGNCFRWWLHVNGTHSPQFTNDSVSGISQASVDNLRTALNMAQERGIGLILCLWSFGMLDTGSGNLDAAQTERNLLMLEDTVYTRAYINNALIPLVDSVKEHPAIVCWEIFNEPEGMASDAHGWAGWAATLTPFSNIQRFINLSTGAIHRTDTSALVSSGAWNVAVNTDVDIGGLESSGNLYSDDELTAAGGDPDGVLDFYMFHFYPDQGPASSPFHHPASYWELDKPIVIGEFRAEDPYNTVDAEQGYKFLYDSGYAGGLAWTWTGHDGNGDIYDAAPGMAYLWDNHRTDVEVLIDSANIDFTPYLVNTIKDTFLVIPTDTVTVRYADLKTIFRDVEDSTILAYNIRNISDTLLVEAEIDEYDTLMFKVRPNQPGGCNIVITATDSSSKFAETSFSISVYDSTSEDVALYRKVTSSTIENSSYLAFYAVDGDSLTRWSTEYDDDQYLLVEFEQIRNIERIFMNWEVAYGQIYNILVSTDGETWDTVFKEPYGNGAQDLIILDPTRAKYVMMDGVQRGTQWGYSLYSFEVYESAGTNTAPFVRDVADTFYVEEGEELIIEASIFFGDDTPGDQLSYAATLEGGNEITGWLSFTTPGSQTGALFTGTPGESDEGSQTIEIEATDRYGETASVTFVITVTKIPDAIEDISLSDITIYPNPAGNKVFINHTNHDLTAISLFDMQGRLIKSTDTNISSGITEMNMNDVESGMYYMVISSNNGRMIKKLIKK
jgi:hypothetical protein